jgi:hypothetical protein
LSVLFLSLLLCFFLFPVAVYCWVLAMVNRRPGPAVVSGPWDFAGLCFAASGFLLIVGPALLTGLYYRALRELPLAHQPATVRAILWDLLAHQWAWWLGYYGLVVGGALLLLWARRRRTLVYNVDPAVLETVLTRALSRLGLPWERRGNRYYLGAPDGGPAVLDVEPFRLMCNVTLRWRGRPGPLRREVEAELTRELDEVRTPDNPAASWLVAVAGCLFGLVFFIVVVLILSGVLGGRP